MTENGIKYCKINDEKLKNRRDVYCGQYSYLIKKSKNTNQLLFLIIYFTFRPIKSHIYC
jgi:hypothetical protein